MHGLRKGFTMVVLVASMLLAGMPAASADGGCMPRLDPSYIVADVKACLK